MSTAVKDSTGKEVVSALMTANTSAQKAKASRLQKEYVAQRVSEGKDPKKVLAGLRSRVSRLLNEKKGKVKAKPAATPKKTTKAKPKAKPKAK
jgi:hypothetical protein